MDWFKKEEIKTRWFQYAGRMSRVTENETFSQIVEDSNKSTIYGTKFPKKELQQQLNKINMELLKRLQILRDTNPDLKDLLEKQFPEIIDKSPFIRSGTLFIKKQYPKNLYVLLCADNYFFVKNVKDNKNWATKIRPTNFKPEDLVIFEEYYLNKYDFNKLLKSSSSSLHTISILSDKDLEFIHTALFNN